MNDYNNTIKDLLQEQDEFQNTNSRGERVYNFFRKEFPKLNNLEKNLFIKCYSKIYEKTSGYTDPIDINTYMMEYLHDAFKSRTSTPFSTGSMNAIKNNLPVYFLSKDFCDKAKDAEIDKNILFEDLTLPFNSFFYMIPEGTVVNNQNLKYINVFLSEDDIYGVFCGNKHIVIPLRDILTRPTINQTLLNATETEDEEQFRHFTNDYINFLTSVLLFHQTAGFDKTVLPITPLPLVKNPNGKIVPGQRKRVSANIIDAPQISYEKRKPTDEEQSSFRSFYKGYYQTRTHIRIKKNKTTGEIKIIGVSSSESNPDKKPESVNFQKRKLSEKEIEALVKTNKDYIIKKLKSLGYSDEEINATLKKYNLGEQ